MKVLILAGGHGSRLWPISTTETPKQFQNLSMTKHYSNSLTSDMTFWKLRIFLSQQTQSIKI